MHPHSPQTTIVTPLPPPQPDLSLLMYRIDQCVAETHRLREEMREGFASVRSDIKEIRKDQEVFRQELNSQRHEFKEALHSQRHEFKEALHSQSQEFKEALHSQRQEFKVELEAMREKSHREFEAMLDRTKVDMKELVASVVATVDDRIEMSGQASDVRLLKWCARSAAGSSAAAGGLVYAVAKLLS